MSEEICHITRDISRPATFFVRFYHHISDIGLETPIDAWECKLIISDGPTLEYLNDLEIVKHFRERSINESKTNPDVSGVDE
jgi:hypothetical protein